MSRIVGVIAEYNPFHSGHAWQLEKVRQEEEALVVAVMSGNFTQRGEPALFDKHLRTAAALSCGVDLVLELPFPYACSRAQDFARMGVQALDALGIVDELSFGCECGDLSTLAQAADVLSRPGFQEEVTGYLVQGLTYAKARRMALASFLGEEGAAVLDAPNNTLAIEYLLALRQLSSSIRPTAVMRKGAGHDSNSPQEGFASGSFLRALCKEKGVAALKPFVPERAFVHYTGVDTRCYDLALGEQAVLWKLRQMEKADFADLPDVSEGLENRLEQAARVCSGMEDFLSRVKTKRYTLARLRRVLLFAALGVNREDLNFSLPYLKILGFTKAGEKLLALAGEKSRVPLLSKGVQIENLSKASKRMHRKTAFATDFFSLLTVPPLPKGEEYRRSVVKQESGDRK